MTARLVEASIAAMSRQLRTRDVSPLELVNAHLQQIASCEEQIGAWAYIGAEGAQRAAKEREAKLLAEREVGPLCGIPVGIKDIFAVAAMPMEAGSPVFAGNVASNDAAVVARLKEAGAIILGKTRTTELAGPWPCATRNPWSVDHTPGGSSSGSAAAVSARMCAAALGSQSGGSTIRPASFTGVVGLKPRLGRVSVSGMLPANAEVDHVGLFARSTEDIALLLEAIAGYDKHDPHSLHEEVPSYSSVIRSYEGPPRVSVPLNEFTEFATSEMRSHLAVVIDRLARGGAEMVELSLPTSFSRSRDVATVVVARGFALSYGDAYRRRPDAFVEGVARLIEDGLRISDQAYQDALAARKEQIADITPVLEKTDVLITPAAPGAAPGVETTGNAVMQAPWSLLGVPTLGLPSGLSSEGLPLGIQLVSDAEREARLLAIGQWCERTLDVKAEDLLPPALRASAGASLTAEAEQAHATALDA
jgi:Asp-tRNA(Asn)/Glu-tRNA(Gln) amidotransferase A subunit family amidase